MQGNTAFRQEANTQDLQEWKWVIGSENEECLVPSKDNSVSKGNYNLHYMFTWAHIIDLFVSHNYLEEYFVRA